MCGSQTLIEAVALIGLVSGRTIGHTSSVTTEGAQSTYTTTVEKHPFFDSSMGSFYNFQSAVICLAPIVAFLGLLLSYLTYQAFPRSLFEPPAGDVAPYQGYGTTLGRGGAGFGGGERSGSLGGRGIGG